jgi:hypothetical protein
VGADEAGAAGDEYRRGWRMGNGGWHAVVIQFIADSDVRRRLYREVPSSKFQTPKADAYWRESSFSPGL